jgi:hypothetical protein
MLYREVDKGLSEGMIVESVVLHCAIGTAGRKVAEAEQISKAIYKGELAW